MNTHAVIIDAFENCHEGFIVFIYCIVYSLTWSVKDVL